MQHFYPRFGAALVAALAIAAPAAADFHQMQIQRAIGGVGGNLTAQAVQLRLIGAAQGNVHQARIRVWDAAGANPIELIDIPTAVINGSLGAKILIASASFPAFTTPPAVPDFTMTALIPESYLAAGSLTFEQSGGVGEGIVYWRLSWGGSDYTGDTTGHPLNDDDVGVGEFGPPWPGAMPSTGVQAVTFQGPAAMSTSNDEDYVLSAGPAVFRNNANGSFTITNPLAVESGSWGAIRALYHGQRSSDE